MAVTALAVGAGVVLGKGSAAASPGGPTCNVPGDYATIQAAVDAAGCNTVKVAPGTYNENVNIARSVTLKGAKAGSDVKSRTAGGSHESTVTGVNDTPAFTVNAANVTIDGFSVTNPNHGLGVTVKTAGNNAVIKNNIVDGVGSPTYNFFTVGVYLELGPDNVKVTDNKIGHIQSVKSAQGILVGDSTSTNPSTGILLDDNTIGDITSTRGAYGIQLNNGAGVTLPSRGYVTAKITSNDIKNLNGAWAHAIGLEGDTPNVTVKRNVVSNLTAAGADKTAVWFESNQFFFTADVHRNNLNVGGAAFGIGVEPTLAAKFSTLSVDGTCNYWGAKNGPSAVGSGNGSHVTTGVDYKPWLKSAKLDGQCSDDKDRHDYNDHGHGHGWDDKDRGRFWDDD
jgi:hypothetical protein